MAAILQAEVPAHRALRDAQIGIVNPSHGGEGRVEERWKWWRPVRDFKLGRREHQLGGKQNSYTGRYKEPGLSMSSRRAASPEIRIPRLPLGILATHAMNVRIAGLCDANGGVPSC